MFFKVFRLQVRLSTRPLLTTFIITFLLLQNFKDVSGKRDLWARSWKQKPREVNRIVFLQRCISLKEENLVERMQTDTDRREPLLSVGEHFVDILAQWFIGTSTIVFKPCSSFCARIASSLHCCCDWLASFFLAALDVRRAFLVSNLSRMNEGKKEERGSIDVFLEGIISSALS